jgi:hypothetical protein
MKKWCLVGLFILVIFSNFYVSSIESVDALSGATALIKAPDFPKNLTLTISGEVKQIYQLDAKQLATLPRMRIRTKEFTPTNEILGAYIYYAVPVQLLLEMVAPQKTSGAKFDRPLDMLVIFHSKEGKCSLFSYGELTLCSDKNPVSLAYYREGILPSKEAPDYNKNRFKNNIQGLKLICPGDKYTSRYLNQVISMKLVTPAKVRSQHLLIAQKGENDRYQVLSVDEERINSIKLNSFPLKTIKNRFRIGHGRGIKGITSSAQGYPIKNILIKYFPHINKEDFFLFLAADGYRAIFSFYEIFQHAQGNNLFLLKSRNGKPIEEGFTLAVLEDFFIDRDVREVKFVERIKPVNIGLNIE